MWEDGSGGRPQLGWLFTRQTGVNKRVIRSLLSLLSGDRSRIAALLVFPSLDQTLLLCM